MRKVWLPVLAIVALLLVFLAAVIVGTGRETPPHAATSPEVESPSPDAARPGRTPRAKAAVAAAEDASAATGVPATTGAVAGGVHLADGTVAAGARIRLVPEGMEEPVHVATADADGKFRADDLAPRRWTVVAAGGGFGTRVDEGAEPSVADVVAGGEARVDLIVTRLAIVAGRVVGPDDRAVAGASLKVQCGAFTYPNESCWELEAKSGEAGAFEVLNVTPGDDVRIHVAAAGFPRATADVPALAPGGRAEIVIRLERSVRLEVVLVDAADGTPVRGAYVWFGDGHGGSFADDSVRTDDRGSRAVDVPAGKPVELQVSADDYVHVPTRVIEDAAALSGPVTVRLVRGLTISGRVLFADERPAPNFEVRAAPPGDPHRGMLGDIGSSATSDAEGRFRLTQLPAGRFEVGAGVPNDDPVVSAVVEAGATDVVLRLPQGARATERVVVRAAGPDGTPAASFRIVTGTHVEDGLVGSGGGLVREGSYEFTVDRRATAFVEIWDARDAAGRRLPLGGVVLDVPDPAPREWIVKLPAERTVEGRVIGPDGKGVVGATIHVRAIPPWNLDEDADEEDGLDFDATDRGESPCAADGTFRVGGLGDAQHVLVAAAPGFVPGHTRVRGGATGVEIRLVAAAPCRVRVLDADGKPVQRVWVYVLGGGVGVGGGGVPAAWTDADGRVSLSGLSSSQKYTLDVGGSMDRTDLVAVRITDWVPADAEIRLERGFAIAGTVRMAAGAAPERWTGRVEALRDDVVAAVVSLGAGGSFRFTRIRQGRWTLRVVAGDEGRHTGTAEAEAGDVSVAVELR